MSVGLKSVGLVSVGLKSVSLVSVGLKSFRLVVCRPSVCWLKVCRHYVRPRAWTKHAPHKFKIRRQLASCTMESKTAARWQRISRLHTDVEVSVIEGLTNHQVAKLLSENLYGRENIDDSFYIFDIGQVAKMYENWNSWFPRIDPFYAVKAGPYEPMVACLAAMSAGFDCASPKEIDLVLRNGVLPDRIIYANPLKTISHMLHAKRNGISTLVFDREPELLKIRKYFSEADLVLRITTDDSRSVLGMSDRFGATVEKAKFLLKRAKEFGMSVIGISFHVGSVCCDPSSYTKALRNSRQLFDYAESLGIQFTVSDIGGGFHGADEQEIRKASDEVNKSLDEFFPADKFSMLRIIAEPGRYFAATPFTLATNVISKSDPVEQSDVEVEYAINEGKYTNLKSIGEGPGEFDPYHLEQSTRKKQISSLFGPTCAGLDIVFKKHTLPEMNVGEWLFWRSAGAYSFGCTTKFNGFGAEKFYNIVSTENASAFNRQCVEEPYHQISRG